MGSADYRRLLEDLQRIPELREEAEAGTRMGTLQGWARSKGYELSTDETERLADGLRELSEDELDKVAGGEEAWGGTGGTTGTGGTSGGGTTPPP